MVFRRKKEKGWLLPLVFVLLVSQSLIWIRIREGGQGDWINLIGSQIVIFLMCLTIWGLLLVLLKRFGGIRQWLKILIGFILAALTSMLFYYASPFEDFPNHPLSSVSWPESFAILLLRGCIIAAIFFPFSIYRLESRKFQRERIEVEQLKRMDLQMQLVLLREQVNPHFLFNALSILQSGTSDRWVKDFVRHLADVYRYLLDYKRDKQVVTVLSELRFVDAYLYILKARFGDALRVLIDEEVRHLSGKIPPLSLQLLLENAVKHNVVAADQPLEVCIYSTPGWLIVRNKIQKKRSQFASSGRIGLANLSARYRLISDAEIKILEDNHYFTVKIPILPL